MMEFLDIKGIYLYNSRVDFRKSIDGLAGIVQEQLKLDPFSKSLFLFFNRHRDKVKVLYWDRSGYALWYKRLEKEKFILPRKILDSKIEISRTQLEWLLTGYDIWKMKPHEALEYQIAA